MAVSPADEEILRKNTKAVNKFDDLFGAVVRPCCYNRLLFITFLFFVFEDAIPVLIDFFLIFWASP